MRAIFNLIMLPMKRMRINTTRVSMGYLLRLLFLLIKKYIKVRLIHDRNKALVMVGYQIMAKEVGSATHILYHPFSLGNFMPAENKSPQYPNSRMTMIGNTTHMMS